AATLTVSSARRICRWRRSGRPRRVRARRRPARLSTPRAPPVSTLRFRSGATTWNIFSHKEAQKTQKELSGAAFHLPNITVKSGRKPFRLNSTAVHPVPLSIRWAEGGLQAGGKQERAAVAGRPFRRLEI